MDLLSTPKKSKRPRYFGHSPSPSPSQERKPPSPSPSQERKPPTPKKPRYFGHSPCSSPQKVSFNSYRDEVEKTDFVSLSNEDKIVKLVVSYGVNTLIEVKSVLVKVPKAFPNWLNYCGSICHCIEKLRKLSTSEIQHLLLIVDELELLSTPITELLWKASVELDTPLCNFIAPKVSQCLVDNCHGKLYGRKDEVIEITTFTLAGPVPGLKVSLSCNNCGARYGIDKFRPSGGEARFYPDNVQAEVVEVTNKVYFSKDTYEFMCESGNHGFVSAQAFSQTYQSVFHANHPSTSKFLSFVSADFKQATDREEHTDSDIEGNTKLRLNPFMSRKNATEAFFNGELENEIRERKMESNVTFKNDDSREEIMRNIDNIRRTELYPHPVEDCNEICQKRGCQNLRVIDSCWKLCIPHCMLAVQTEVEGSTLLNFPNVCTEEPMPGSVFCRVHHELLVKHNVPTEKKQFLTHIGCKENPKRADEIQKVDDQVLSFMSKLQEKDEHMKSLGTSAVQYQGTSTLLHQMPAHVLNDDSKTEAKCNKDTGEKARLRQRARGHFVAVTGGGNILCFNPIYKSESPSQVFMLAIQLIYSEVKNLPDEAVEKRLQDYILSYDNMCNLDKLKAAREDLPLPGSFARMWHIIRKIIDRLHLRNHKQKRCQELYNPETVLKEEEKSLNTMAAEQLFSWMSRFKKVVNSMTQTHHLFYLHRMCKRRNKYSALCRRRGVEPVHPGVNMKL